jgi:predicted acylesterase/phospholipase RssA
VPARDIDIDLVVGTSGGSINALLVALGATRNSDGQKKLKEMWGSFQEKEFFQPDRVFKLAFGLSLGLLQALILTAVSLAFAREQVAWKKVAVIFGFVAILEFGAILHAGARTQKALAVISIEGILLFVLIGILRLLRCVLRDWWRVAGWGMLFCSVAGLLVRAMAQKIVVKWVDSDLGLHLWATMKLVGGWAFPWPLVLGLLMAVSGFWRQPRINWHPLLIRALTLAMIATSGFLIWDVIAREKSLSDVEGVKGTLIAGFPQLVAPLAKISAGTSSNTDAALEDLSTKIVNSPSLLRDRDLVVTASRLVSYPQSSQIPPKNCGKEEAADVEPNFLPSDLYFYFAAKERKGPQFPPGPPAQDPRYISILNNPAKLLNIVVGSSTIYPIFPSQTLNNICLGPDNSPKQRVRSIRIVDGGYIHNSPIDAARNWGATHILLIEASPRSSEAEPKNFLGNAAYAFNFLFDQAQRIDKQAGNAVELFQLRPTSDCDRLEAHHHKNADEGSEECNDKPNANLDLFDFEQRLLQKAIDEGEKDIGPVPLFERVAGPPVFRVATGGYVPAPPTN